MRKVLFTLGLLALAGATQAADIGLGLSDKAAAVDYAGYVHDKGLGFTLGWLHHTDNGEVVTAGVQVNQKLDRNVQVGLGAKAVGIFNDYDDASAIALGGEVNIAIPPVQRLYFGMNGWFAPGIVSFGGARSYTDFGATLSYRVIDDAALFVGYRYAKVRYDDYHTGIVMQDGPLIGMRLYF